MAGRHLRARMGKQNPPSVGEAAYLVVRPENLRPDAGSERFCVKIVNRLFEGVRIDYHAEIPGSNQTKPFSMSVPFLPGTELIDVGAEIEASLTVPEFLSNLPGRSNPEFMVIIRSHFK